ncbi:MAG: serine--tRNA ligase, partial [Bacteroidales bacterium]|nr:serine--tRNA ligase [Bacteroidales bacterium]
MLTLKLLRENPEFVIERLQVKHFDAKQIVYEILDMDHRRRAAQTELDACLAQQKQKAAEIGSLMKQGRRDEAETAKQAVAALKEKSKALETEMAEAEKKQQELVVLLPNLPCALVPEGRTAEDNVVVKMGGPEPHLPEHALPHWELVKNLDIIDFDLGVKLTGAGFPVYKGKGAKIQRALISWFLEKNTDAGYLEYQPPYMVNADSGFGTGQLPDKEGQMYFAPLDGFYMIPTAEVPVTNIYRDVILKPEDFPVKMTAYTPCWR